MHFHISARSSTPNPTDTFMTSAANWERLEARFVLPTENYTETKIPDWEARFIEEMANLLSRRAYRDSVDGSGA